MTSPELIFIVCGYLRRHNFLRYITATFPLNLRFDAVPKCSQIDAGPLSYQTSLTPASALNPP
jgi:hypothetical protein